MNYQKLLVLGLAAIISTNAFAHTTPTEQSIQRVTAQVQALQQKNIIPKVNVNFIVKPASEIIRSKAHALYSLHEENCTINIDVNPNLETGYIGTKENRDSLKEITSLSNLKQEQLRTDYTTYHEMAHCRLVEIKTPFKAENKNVENTLNKYYQHGAPSLNNSSTNKYDNSLYDNLQENFADTFAFIQLIKKHGADKDLLILIQKTQIERSDLSNTLNSEALIAHNTEFSLKELLKEENIKKIISTNSEHELENIALNIANKGMWEAIKTHGDVYKINNPSTLQDGAAKFFKVIALKNINNNNENGNAKEKNLNLELQDNALYQIGEAAYNELNIKFNLKNLKSETDFNSFVESNAQEITDTLSNHFYAKIEMEDAKGIQVFDLVESHVNTVNLMKKQTVEELKTNGAEAIKTAENLASKLSVNSVLKNMESIRQVSLNSPNKTVHIKYGN